MNIAGLGGGELVAIFIIMLIVAGPKRMIQWAYIAGKYVAQLRKMWSETMAMVQREFDEAGIDVQLPKEPPTRGSMRKTMNSMVENAMKPVSDPLKETLDEATEDIKSIEKALDDRVKEAKAVSTAKESEESGSTNGSEPALGSWSNLNKSD